MAFQGTKLNNLIDPEVIGQFLDVKLINAIKLSPLVGVDRTLEGRPGSTLTLPKFAYIGMAEDVAEGEAMTPVALSETSVDVKVKKAGKAVSISDEAILSGYGDPVNEIGRQLLMSMADKIEKDLYDEMEKATKEVVYTAFDKDVIVDAQLKFGEDINEQMFLLVNPAEYAVLRKDPDFVQIMNGEKVISGQVGRIYGADIIVADRVTAGKAYLMKQGALQLIMKRNVMCEADRDILNMTNVFTANEHFVAYLKYADRVVKIHK